MQLQFIFFTSNVSLISEGRVTGEPGESTVVVIHFFSTSMCSSSQKCVSMVAPGQLFCCQSISFNLNMSFIQTPGSAVVFLLSGSHWRLLGWMRFFNLNFSLVFNAVSFFAGFFNGLQTCFNF